MWHVTLRVSFDGCSADRFISGTNRTPGQGRLDERNSHCRHVRSRDTKPRPPLPLPPSGCNSYLSQSHGRRPPRILHARKADAAPCGVKSEPVKTPVSAPRHVLLQQCFADHRNNGTKERHVVPCHVKVRPERRRRGSLEFRLYEGSPARP
jgi:hypothetical protein